MRIVLIRHGESEMNLLSKKRSILNGQAETPLTKQGIDQAKMLGRQLAAITQLHATLAVSSTLQRSIETAKISLQCFPAPIPLLLSDGLRERSLGLFEGQFTDEVYAAHPQYRDDPTYNRFRADFVQKAPGGENLTEVTDRAWKALQEYTVQCDGDLLVFSHATTIRCLMGRALEIPQDTIPTLKIPNASPIFLIHKNNRYSLENL